MLLILFSIGSIANAQKDSLKDIKGEIGLRGVWQTGTLNQLIITPTGKLKVENSHVHLEANARYDFFLVSGMTIKNDLWSDIYFQFNPSGKIYPFMSGLTGFSQSYKIDYSNQVAVGIGANLVDRKSNRYFQANLGVGYFNLKYTQEIPHHAISLAPLLKMKMPIIGKKLALSLDFIGYLSLHNTDYFGLHNQLGLHVLLTKGFSIHLNHTTIYNKISPQNIASINTKLLFGMTYSRGKKS